MQAVTYDSLRVAVVEHFAYYPPAPFLGGAPSRLGDRHVVLQRLITRVLDFEVQKFTRRCAVTDRELQPGETFYSALIPEGADVVRRDYCVEAWEGPPSDAIGTWKSEVPDPKARKVHWAPSDVMLHYFVQLQETADQADTRYVLALLMIRRRILKLETTETNEAGQEELLVYCPRNETEYRVAAVVPSEDRVEAIQQDLAELLFAKGAAT